MAILVETAYAKINLALHVRKRRTDGYHELESLFAFAEDGESLTLTEAEDWGLSLSGPFARDLTSTVDNLVLRAAQRFSAHYGIAGRAHFRLEKNLPVASGIGGGSADAAAALRLLARHCGVDPGDQALIEIARTLGADVPACLASRMVRGEGVGELLTPVDAGALAGTPLLLVNPRIPLGTAEVFRGWDGVDRGALAVGNPLRAALGGRNDLTAPAITLVPEITDILDFLESLSGVTLARMSGSGATCFALFETIAAREVGAAMVRLAMPDCWAMESKVR